MRGDYSLNQIPGKERALVNCRMLYECKRCSDHHDICLCDPQKSAVKWEKPLHSFAREGSQSSELAAGGQHGFLQGTSPTSTCVFVHVSLVEAPRLMASALGQCWEQQPAAAAGSPCQSAPALPAWNKDCTFRMSLVTRQWLPLDCLLPEFVKSNLLCVK